MDGDGVKLLLFDIDGTLVRSAGAGKYSMDVAFKTVYGLSNGFDGIPMMGRTDPAIVDEALGNHDLSRDPDSIEKFRAVYFNTLAQEIEKPRPGKRVCAGIPELLEALNERSDVILGLLTGNWKTSAFVKLQHFGIDGYFRMGAFADDSADRSALAPVAVSRLKHEMDIAVAMQDVIIIGDTPLDVAAAKPHGAATVAVATGFHDLETLHSSDPDFVYETLENTAGVVSDWLEPA